MKKKFALVIIFSCCIKLFAASGLLSGEKDIKVAQTQFFDIIYPARCEKTAAMLFNNADRIYKEVTDFMCTSVEIRLPVVITPAVEQLNAFFSPMPYNHIVLYDTSVNGAEELAVFSEQFLSVFKHELTHAITFNMKNKFWSGVDRVFGDILDVGYLGISTGLAESATLTSESSLGEGRLNDEYAKQIVKQAKIEGKFPKASDVLGATTKTNVNHPYYFNGPFAQFLQDTYGREAYSQYWYYIVNAQRINAFKAAFGISKETAWKLFEESYDVPKIPSNPVASNIVQDFFIKESKDYSKNNNAGAFYSSLTSSNNKIAWLDKSCGKIYSLETNQLDNDELKLKKILQITGTYSISLSNDGNYLAISTFSNSKTNTKAYISIYDLKTKQLYKIKESGLRDGSVIFYEGQYYLIATKYETPNCLISVSKINLNDKGRIIGVNECAKVMEPLNAFPGKYTALPTGEFAFILKEGINYSICVSDLNGTINRKYKLPERMVIHSLSFSNDESVDYNLFFSYALPGTMPRYGKLSVKTGKMDLSQLDISGGVYTPITKDKDVIYVGNFYEQSRLLRLPNGTECPDFKSSVLVPESENTLANENADFGDDLFIPNAKKFNPFNYYKKGIFIPASIYTTEYFGCNSGYTSAFNFTTLGVTYITANPWSSGTDDLAILSAGYNIFNSSVGFEYTLSKGAPNGMISTQTALKTEFDKKGWKQSAGDLEVSSTIPFGRVSNLLFANSSVAKIGRQDLRMTDEGFEKIFADNPLKLFGCASSVNNIVYYTLSEVVSAGYSNIHRTGAGTNEKAGILAQVSAGYWYESSLENDPCVFENSFNMNAAFSAYIPRLLPIENKYAYTLNLPTVVSVKLFPSSTHLAYQNMSSKLIGRSLMDEEIETILFAYDIQKALPFMSVIYANNLTLSGGYAGSFVIPSAFAKTGFQMQYIPYYCEHISSGDIQHCDSLFLKFAMGLSPNAGVLSGLGVFNLYTLVSVPLHYYGESKSGKVQFGISGGF